MSDMNKDLILLIDAEEPCLPKVLGLEFLISRDGIYFYRLFLKNILKVL